MALEKLLKQIRMIIREEIEYALEKRLDESTSIKSKQSKSIEHGMSLMREISKPKQKQPVKTKTGLSIQDILNETRMSIESAMEDDYPTMKFNSSMVSTPNVNNMVPDGYSTSEITPEVEKALTRDYSALVAKMNEKSGR